MKTILRPPATLILLAIAAGAALGSAGAEPSAEDVIFFESKVRPILADNCYRCHSLEKGKSKGGLTMDTREGLLKGGEDGEVVKAGDPDGSPLIRAVRYADKDLQMPPKKGGAGKLTDAEIATLEDWVKRGAPIPASHGGAGKLTGLTESARRHWAFQPITKPAIPAVKNGAWCSNAVDAFVLSKLEQNGMIPAPDAAKEALLRRATYDLTGLPPTINEMLAFLSDSSPQAFSKVVDRLLASPAYGERWGRLWLDSARYADTIGGDNPDPKRREYHYPYAWTYRDYVIKAFNDDKPYDQFIVEQLAADQLPKIKPNDERLAALGFLTVGEKFNNPNDAINDRIDTMSKAFLALTVACARCHDHKFDPIPTADYYALHGIFASTIEPNEKPLIAPPTAKLAEFQKQFATLEQQDRDIYYRVIGAEDVKFQGMVTDYLLTALRKNQEDAARVKQEEAARAKAEAVKKPRKPFVPPRRLDPDLLENIAARIKQEDSVFIPFKLFAELDAENFTEKTRDILAVIATGNSGGKDINPVVAAAFKNTNPQTPRDVAEIYGRLFARIASAERDYLKAVAAAKELPVPGLEAGLADLLELPFRAEPGATLDTDRLREVVNGWPKKMREGAGFVFSRIDQLLAANDGGPGKAMAVADSPSPQDSSVFIRGQAEVRGEVVPRRFLEILSHGNPKAFTHGSGRLELAQSIANPANPLTARVLVNRVWMHHFGEGFVRTLDNLGTQSEAPSHQELLDYLTTYFIENGWSLKKLHRLIMLSRVYRESSATNGAFEQIDPQNRLLWRANIRRLDFEAVRDTLLAFSGKLDRKMGGPPVNLTEEPYSDRRSVYGYIDRGNLPELMRAFDFSNPDMANSQRSTTVVPQQALFLMNSPMAIDVARSIMARPEIAKESNSRHKVYYIYLTVFQRAATVEETDRALKFINAESEQDAAVQASAKAMTGKAEKKAEANAKRLAKEHESGSADIQNPGRFVERKPLTPWETYTHALLLSNEASYVN
jgi:hypothetical protein